MAIRPIVSLYIPCYNAQSYIGPVIEAALAQTYRPAEIVVVDDGSTDESEAIASRYPIRYILRRLNLGLAAARNTGFKNTTGEIVAALDADVVASPDWLEQLLGGLNERFSGAGGCLLEAHQTKTADRWRGIMLRQNHGPEPAENKHIFGCNSVWRRSVFERIGGYDESFRGSYEDTVFWARARSLGVETRYIPSSICYHQRQDTVLGVILTCHGWRRPAYELGGLYSSSTNLLIGWLKTTPDYVQQALNIATQGGLDLGGLSLLNILIHFLKDLAVYGEKNPQSAADVIPHAAGAIALIGMIITPPSSAERQNLFDQLSCFVQREPTLLEYGGLASINSMQRYTGASAEEALALTGHSDDPGVRALRLALPTISNELQRLAQLTKVVPKLLE